MRRNSSNRHRTIMERHLSFSTIYRTMSANLWARSVCPIKRRLAKRTQTCLRCVNSSCTNTEYGRTFSVDIEKHYGKTTQCFKGELDISMESLLTENHSRYPTLGHCRKVKVQKTKENPKVHLRQEYVVRRVCNDFRCPQQFTHYQTGRRIATAMLYHVSN